MKIPAKPERWEGGGAAKAALGGGLLGSMSHVSSVYKFRAVLCVVYMVSMRVFLSKRFFIGNK